MTQNKPFLVWDTETSGKAYFRAPATAKHQPYLVQLGAQLYDADFKVRGEINLIIKPEGWVIPKEAADLHGITTETAEKCGVPLFCALAAFRFLSRSADVFVAHNIQFDALMMEASYARVSAPTETLVIPVEKTFCTMKATTPICKLPGNYGDYKWPKLQEAHKHIFGQEFIGAHDAMADVRACASIYSWLIGQRENQGITANKTGEATQTEAML